MRVVVCDLDDTLIDSSPLKGYLRIKPRNWRAFNAGLIHCKPHQDIVDLVKALQDAMYPVVFATAREETLREASEVNIRAAGLSNERAPIELFMRKAGDYRPSPIIKVEQLDLIISKGYDPIWWMDDDNDVVAALRAKGQRVLHVQEGRIRENER